jgi:hypothetical protein
MQRLFHAALGEMSEAFRVLESLVPKPEKVPFKGSFLYRFPTKGIEEAILQKLARIISALHASDVLLVGGFIQELGVLRRTLDEMGEDLLFLAAAVSDTTLTDNHRRYLEAFWDESVMEAQLGQRTKKPDRIPQKKIRAHITNELAREANPSRAADNDESLSAFFSAYVHASSPVIMEMYQDLNRGDGPQFQIQGLGSHPSVAGHVHDMWNYYLRGLYSCACVAKVFGSDSLLNKLKAFIIEYESSNGKTYTKDHRVET